MPIKWCTSLRRRRYARLLSIWRHIRKAARRGSSWRIEARRLLQQQRRLGRVRVVLPACHGVESSLNSPGSFISYLHRCCIFAIVERGGETRTGIARFILRVGGELARVSCSPLGFAVSYVVHRDIHRAMNRSLPMKLNLVSLAEMNDGEREKTNVPRYLGYTRLAPCNISQDRNSNRRTYDPWHIHLNYRDIVNLEVQLLILGFIYSNEGHPSSHLNVLPQQYHQHLRNCRLETPSCASLFCVQEAEERL
jgi:hypothetical protein